MSSIFSELGGITAGTAAEGLAFAAGFAASRALEPAAVTISQDAWNAAPVLRLPPSVAAEAAAENYAAYGAMADEATYHGWDNSRFAYLYDVTLTAPGMGELLNMLRRGTISTTDFSHGLRKAKLETRWDTALEQLATQYIGLGDIAYAIVRGILPAPSYVPVAPPTHGDKVPRYPQVNIDPEALAAKLGYDPAMLEIMVGRSGLSLAPVMAANALFRQIIGPDDFLMAVAEGDLRTEWADTLREVSRQILTSHDYAELQLRGYLTRDQRLAATGQHGMSQNDSDLLYDVLGRAPSIRQVYVGLARGATYDGNPTTIPSPYLEAAERSNLRPEWYSIAYENRYSLPSAFVTRALLTDGAIDATRGATILEHSGWPPDLATLVADHYAAKAGTSGDPHVTKAQTTAWTKAQASYIAEESTAADVQPIFTALGVPATAQTQIVSLWDEIRRLVRKQLTPAQIKKAYAEGVINPATGAAWTQAEALAALEARGYDAADATVILEL